jgi:hypothetical protein
MKNAIIKTSLLLLLVTGLLVSFTWRENKAVRHVVVFKYKASATAAQIDELTQAFKALKGKIPGIVAFEHGVNNSPENLNKGFTHVYLLTFESAAARDSYLPHPAHKEFGALLGRLNILEEPFVIDYEITE